MSPLFHEPEENPEEAFRDCEGARARSFDRAFDPVPDDERLLDLLVDGELNLEERRELFARLDLRPENWKRCALAFLEDQALRGDLKSVLRAKLLASVLPTRLQNETEIAPVTPLVQSAPVASYRQTSRSRPYYALAAGVLVAFTFGVASRNFWPIGQSSDPGVSTDPTTSTGVGPAFVQSHAQVGTPQSPVGAGPDSSPPPQLVSDGLTGALTWEGEGPHQSRMEIPVFAGPGFDEHWVENQPSPFPENLRRSLELRGLEVQQVRRLVPIDLSDGRRVLVPVDQVEVRVKGTRSYQ